MKQFGILDTIWMNIFPLILEVLSDYPIIFLRFACFLASWPKMLWFRFAGGGFGGGRQLSPRSNENFSKSVSQLVKKCYENVENIENFRYNLSNFFQFFRVFFRKNKCYKNSSIGFQKPSVKFRALCIKCKRLLENFEDF